MSNTTLNIINFVGLFSGFLLLAMGVMGLVPECEPMYAAFAPFCLTLGSIGMTASVIHLWRRNLCA